MTPAKAATLLDQWAKNAKTDESRAVCEMAAVGMRNSAMAREIAERSSTSGLTIQYVRDSSGNEMFFVWTHKGPSIVAPTLSEALAALLEKASK